MEVINSPEKMQRKALSLKQKGRSISCVPTMGFLHEGHLSLIRAARSAADILVVTIFVNPAQFSPTEDLSTYPRDLERDLILCEKEGVDIVFNPGTADIYPEGYSTYIEETDLSNGLCGAARPGHFRGVTTVVSKIFNIVQPDSAFFGRKDYQQLSVIRKMVKDLNIPVRIVGCPIVREEDGLAMSSRNKNLNPEQREEALCLHRALLKAEELFKEGENDATMIRASMEEIVEKEPSTRIDYIEIRDGKTLELTDRVGEGILIALAVFIGKTRLIDNLVVRYLPEPGSPSK
ncbi:MAG: pantoate--beta-alanine ligase [Candidatus Auribacterota bacterium]|nr:pantoate--beta-alanine ligase [Candidatus Auribacterota bacterium]